MACGTGACAASYASYLYKSTNNELNVDLEGGKLRTLYNRNTKRMTLIGNSEMVFKGKINL